MKRTSTERKQPNTQQQKHQQHQQHMNRQQHQHKNPTKLQFNDGHEYIDFLNIISELSSEVINEDNDFSQEDKERAEEDMKKVLLSIVEPFAENIQLPNGQPLPLNSLISEPENQELLLEEQEWKLKSREALRQNIDERRNLVKTINPLIQKAVDIESMKVTGGTFDDSSDDELGDSMSLEPKLQQDMKNEFTDSMELLTRFQKETPQRLAQFAEIEKIMEQLENSTSSSSPE